jgi:tetratricopeptide (TPR) repeat protein
MHLLSGRITLLSLALVSAHCFTDCCTVAAQQEQADELNTPEALAPVFIDSPLVPPSNASSDSAAESESESPPEAFPGNQQRPNPVRPEAAGSSGEPRRLKAQVPREAQAAAKTSQGRKKPTKPSTASTSQQAPALEPEAAAAGDTLVSQAISMSKGARSEEAYNRILELCERAKEEELSDYTTEYINQLTAWTLNRRGELRGDAGQDSEALADFEGALAADPSTWRAMHNRGVLRAKLGQYEEAIEDFNQTVRLNPKFANAYFNRGELRYEMGEFAAAIQDYDGAIKLSPKDSAAYNSRGHAYYRLDQFDEAIRDYSLAIRFEPKNAAAYTNRGDAHCDRGSYAQAAKDYQMAMKLDPRLGRAWQSAAWLMATCPQKQFRNARLALEAAEKAIELDGSDDHLYLETLAAAQANAGKFEQAKQTIIKVIEMAPIDETERYQACLALYEKNQPYREPPKNVPGKLAAPAGSGARQATLRSLQNK